jgi:selenocysteine lyase/cysteine desulfurase
MDPEALRADIPACESCTYLNTGASGPSPRRVVEAATGAVEHHEFETHCGEGPYQYVFGEIDDVREQVADFVGAETDEIAMTESTADGISTVAAAVPWVAGDTVVRTDLEHPAGTLPFERARDLCGAEVRELETEAGRLDMDALKDAVADARLLVLSSLSWNYGTQLRVAEAVDIAHDAGAQVLVDAVQTVGQQPLDVKSWGADFVACAGHKWLLGPWGAGILYADREAVETLEPRRAGYRSVEATDDGWGYLPGARRFEMGTASPGPIAGLSAAIDTIESVGMDTVTDRIERLTDRLKDGLGDRCLSPAGYESGLVTFEAEDPEATVERLAGEGIQIRTLPEPEACRASVHAFNTAEDIDRLLAAL